MAQIKKLSDGKYLIRVSKGTGRARIYVNKTFRGTLVRAREWARQQETRLDSGQGIESTLAFEQYFELWLTAVTPRLAPRTVDGYDGYIRRYALKTLGSLKLANIRPLHVEAIYAGLKLSSTTIRNLHAALRGCFSYAVKKDLLRVNPCTKVDLPAKQRNEVIVLDEDEAAILTTRCRTMYLGIIFELALQTGMRPEEYLALRWRDISGREISVSQAVQFRKGGGYYFKDVKTARARRRVPISESLRLRLVRHRREQNEHRLSMKGTWFNHDLVFSNEIGRPFSISNITRRYFAPILAACGFEKHITLYALRHSCATILLMNGENPKVVADRLGHASVVITLDTYSHVLPHIQDAATDVMERVMSRGRE